MKLVYNYFKDLLGNIKKPNPAQPEVLIIIFIVSMISYRDGVFSIYKDYEPKLALVMTYFIVDRLIGIRKFSLKTPLFLFVIITLFLLAFIINGLDKGDFTISFHMLVFTILLCIEKDK